MKCAAILALGLGLSTSLAQAEPVTLAEQDLGEVTAGLVPEITLGDINVAIGIATVSSLQAAVVTPIAVAPFGQATASGGVIPTVNQLTGAVAFAGL